jgi:predicted Zn-dependent peptidase
VDHGVEHIIRIDSGLTVAVDPMPSSRSVAVGVWVDAGARDEPDHLTGVSHFLEHLVFKGTPTRSATDISRAVDRVGGDINAFTSKEYTSYYLRVPARHALDGIELLGDVVCAPALRHDELENERQVILEELAMDDDDPDDVLHRRFARQLFGAHPLGRDTAGQADTVAAISADDVHTFHAAHYVPGSTVVAVAGAVDVDDIVAAVEQAFAGLPAGPGRAARSGPGQPSGDAAVDDDTEQVHLLLGGRGVARLDDDREALDVVNHVLGGGLSSRLFDEIRERRGLAYSVHSGLVSYVDCGAWSVYVGTMPAHLDEVRRIVAEQLGLLAEGGITDDELAIAVGYLTGAYELGLEDTGARMSRLGGSLVTTGAVRSVDEQLERWRRVTHDDVRRVIERVYRPQPLTVTLGPEVPSAA